jgi:hypothetical protein
MPRLSVPVFLVAAVAATVPLLAAEAPPARGPLAVFVQARPDEAERSASEQSALKSKADAASKPVEQLGKELRKKFGKDAAKWPEDERRAYYDALDVLGVAWSESYYYARPAKEKADSVEDTSKHLGKERKNAYVTLAPRREDADLVIEIMGRKGQAKFITGPKYLGFDVLPGKLPADALLGLPREQFKPWFEDRMLTLHWPKRGEPFFRFEASDTERWQDVAKFVATTVEELAKTYYETLKPAH